MSSWSHTVLVAGAGVTYDGATLALLPTYDGYLSNANDANGVVVADGDGIVAARFRPFYGTSSELAAFVGTAGELGSDGTSIRLFDGAQAGGFPINLNSESCRYVAATGTALENGAAFHAAVTALQALTPYGSALSPSNPATLFMGPGTYDLTGNAGHTRLAKSGLRIVGLGGSPSVKIQTDATHRLEIYADGSHWTDTDGCLDHGLIGLAFESLSGTPGPSLLFTVFAIYDVGYSLTMYHDDLDFVGLTTAQSAMAYNHSSNTHPYTVAGLARRVRTNGRGLYGGWGTPSSTVNPAVILTVGFELCYAAGDRSFGGSSGTQGQRDGRIDAPGYLYRCSCLGTTDGRWSAILNAEMRECNWAVAVTALGSGADIADCRIAGVNGSGKSVDNGSAVNAKIAYSRLAGGIGSNVTNLLSATLDGAANIVDGDA